MTTIDQMRTEVRIAQLKSRLSAYLRAAQAGEEIVVKDRNTPIAIVVPYEKTANRLASIPPTRALAEVEALLKKNDQRPRPRNLRPGDALKALQWTRRDYIDKRSR